jgi:cation diffusion facilitator CzcD-associated flavoprotein CzcO
VYSFTRPDWDPTQARHGKLKKYQESVVDDFGLRPQVRTGVGVERVRWDENLHRYLVEFDDGSTRTCHVVISALGFLNVPGNPDFPGLDTFRGPAFHTPRLEHEHDLTGERLAAIGTGSTASQLISEVTAIASKVVVFQHEPGWVIPKGDRDFIPDERQARRNWWTWQRAPGSRSWSASRRPCGGAPTTGRGRR